MVKREKDKELKKKIRREIGKVVPKPEMKQATVSYVDVNPIDSNTGSIYSLNGSTAGLQLDQGIGSAQRVGIEVDIHKIEIRFMTAIAPVVNAMGGAIRCLITKYHDNQGTDISAVRLLQNVGAGLTYTAARNMYDVNNTEYTILKDFTWTHSLPTDVHASVNRLDEKYHKIVLKFKKPIRTQYVGAGLTGFASVNQNLLSMMLFASEQAAGLGVGGQMATYDVQRTVWYTDA